MSNNSVKKAFAVASSSALILASFASFATAAVHQAGTTVLTNGTVYFISPDGTRRGYTSAGAFLSYGVNSWSKVVPASAEDLALPIGASFIPPMDGSLINDNGTIWVMSNGKRSGFTTMAVFTGRGYSLSNVLMGDTSFMQSNPAINDTVSAHPVGALVNQAGTVYLVTPTGLMGIPSQSVFNSWGYSFSNVVPANAADAAIGMSAGIMPSFAMGRLTPYDGVVGTTPLPVSSGSVSVSASSDMPASATIVAGQAAADLAHFTFTGNGTLSAMTLQRIGVSANTTLNNVYLFNGATRVADSASVNSNGVVAFNGLNIPVNGSLNLAVKADIATGISGQTIGVTLTSYTISGASSAATVSLSGNLMSVSNATLAGVNVGATTVSAASVNAGTTGYSLWSSPVTVSTRTVLLKGATFKYVGSATTDSFANLQLYVNGSPVGPKSTINAQNNLVFDLSGAPLTLNTGSSTLEIRGDLIKGSNRNASFILQNAADLAVTDTQLNVNVGVVSLGATTFSQIAGGVITINPGTVTTTLDPNFNSVTTVTGGATGATIGSFKLTSYGEDVKINTLSVTPSIISATAGASSTSSTGVCTGTCGVNNVSLFANGAQVGSSQNWTTGALSFNLGSSLIIPAGTSITLAVKADMQTALNVNYTAGTVSATVNVGTSNAQGLSSLNTVAVPAASITSNGLTVTTGALSIAAAPGYAAQTVNGNQAGVKIGSYVIQNTSTAEPVRVTSLAVALSFAAPTYTSGAVTAGAGQSITFSSTAGMTVGNILTIPGATPAVGNVTSVTNGTVAVLTITTGGVTPTVGGAVTGSGTTIGPAVLTNISNLRTSETSGSGATPVNPAASNNFSVNFTLAPGATKQIDILADLGTSNFGAVTTTLLPTAVGANSNVVLTPGSATTGQVVTLASGTVAAPTLNSVSLGGTLASQFVVGGSSPVVAQYNFVASNGTAVVTELKFAITSGAGNTITQVCIPNGNGSTTVCAPVVSGTADITGLALNVPNLAAGINVNVAPTYAAVGTNGVPSNTTSVMTLNYVRSISGGITTIANPSVAAQTMTLVGTKPTVTLVPSTATLINGLVNVGYVTVAADPAGDIKLTALPINVTSAGVATVPTGTNNVVIQDASGNTIPESNGTFVVAANSTSGDVAVTLTGGYLIPAGTSKVFSIFVTAATVSGATGTTSLVMKLGAQTLFGWTDQVGGVTITGVSLLYNYPTTTSYIHN